MKLTHGSLFSGVGGFDLAARWMGWDNVFHCEIDEWSRKNLHKNFPESDSHADISLFDGKPYKGKIDIISGGFPCQDISISKTYGGGATGIKGSRSGLWKEYGRIIREIGPGIIVFENSPMLTTRGLEYVLCDLSKLGFDAEWRYFYASQFGFPHLRARIYGVAYSRSKRWKNIAKNGGILQKILPKRTPRPDRIPMPTQRFNRHSDYSCVRMDDGFPDQLDKRRIKAMGNAVLPIIPYSIFETLDAHTPLI